MVSKCHGVSIFQLPPPTHCAYLYVWCFHVCLVCLSVYLPACGSVCLSVSLFVCLSVRVSVCLSTRLPACLLLPFLRLPRRFKDGSIVEAVVWKGKGAQRHRVVEQASPFFMFVFFYRVCFRFFYVFCILFIVLVAKFQYMIFLFSIFYIRKSVVQVHFSIFIFQCFFTGFRQLTSDFQFPLFDFRLRNDFGFSISIFLLSGHPFLNRWRDTC